MFSNKLVNKCQKSKSINGVLIFLTLFYFFVVKTQKIGINICESEYISRPLNDSNEFIDISNLSVSTSGIQIPLSIGEPRKQIEEGNEMLIVDVVVNPIVVIRSRVDLVFNAQLIDLVLHWTEQECQIKLSRRYRKLQESSIVSKRNSYAHFRVLTVVFFFLFLGGLLSFFSFFYIY